MKTKTAGTLLIAGLIVFSVLAAFATPASAGSLTIYPSDDSWVDSKDPNKTHGGDLKLHVRYKNGERRRTYIKADLTGLIPEGQTITSAKLYLRKEGGDNVAWNIGAYTVSSSWTQSGITWNNAPRDFAWISTTSVGPTDGIDYCWDVTSAAQDAYAGGQPLSLALKLVDETSVLPTERHHDFIDRSIVITYDTVIPEFSTIAIPVAAVLGLLFIFSRKRKRAE
ncbi:MAG: DNRLRE domain-containing protein [Halobacteriota archaeon]